MVLSFSFRSSRGVWSMSYHESCRFHEAFVALGSDSVGFIQNLPIPSAGLGALVGAACLAIRSARSRSTI